MGSTLLKRELASLPICKAWPDGCSALHRKSDAVQAEHPPAKSGFDIFSPTASAGKEYAAVL